jgi:hypothetical protein
MYRLTLLKRQVRQLCHLFRQKIKEVVSSFVKRRFALLSFFEGQLMNIQFVVSYFSHILTDNG